MDILNYAKIILIAKKEDPNEVRDYRPIALLNSIIKIVMKVLANRITPVLQEIIGEQQTSFILDRNILEGIALAQKIVHLTKKTEMDSFILKLDFKKVYDSVSWECLLEILEILASEIGGDHV